MRQAGLIIAGLSVFVFVGIGRMLTFHDTEMEAAVNGWRWWLAAFGSAAISAFLLRRKSVKAKA